MTKLVKEQPFRPFLDIDINRLFREDLDGLMKTFESTPVSLPSDVSVDDNAAYIEIAAAGYTKEDVKLEAKAQVLTINIIANEEEDTSNGKVYFSRKISKRKFKKSYTFSNEFDLTATEAKMENGLLKLVVPRKESSLPVEISVE